MKNNDFNKENIVSLDEKRKQKQEEETIEQEMDNSSEVMDRMIDLLFANMDTTIKDELKGMIGSYGMRLGDEEKNQIEKVLDSDELQKMIGEMEIGEDGIPSLKGGGMVNSDEMKKQYDNYRELFQWKNIYKPYTLDKFMSYEELSELAKKMKISCEKPRSKSDLLQEMVPVFPNFLQEELIYYDASRMNWLSKLMYGNGTYHLSQPLTELEENQVDYFERQGFFFRINDNGIKTLVMPKEVQDAMYSVDFTKIEKLSEYNTKLVRYVMGIANVYGVYPVKMATDSLFGYFKDEAYFNTKEKFCMHFEQLMKRSFGNMFLIKSYYSGINVSSQYIYHGTVGFAEQFYHIQQEQQVGYKELDFTELEKKGELQYYEESIHLNRAFEALCSCNRIEETETDSVKYMMYVFSKLEFQPNTVLMYLESMYQMPEGSEYDKLISSFSKISEITEKWMLKGNAMKEDTDKKSDPFKVINVDFWKNH